MSKKKQPRPVAIVTADTHLQERAWHSRPELKDDAFEAFRFIVKTAIELELPIIAAGDLIDRQRNDAIVAGFVRRQMDRMKNANLRLMYIQGQHERQFTPWFSEVHSHPRYLPADQRPALDGAGGMRVYGIDWTPRDQLPAELDRLRDTIKESGSVDVLVMHQVMHEFLGGITQAELDWSMVPDVKMLIIGDYHEKHERFVRTNAAGNDMIVLNPGSTAMQSITEPPVKKFFVLYDDFTTQSIVIPGRPFLKSPDLHTEGDLDAFVEKVGGQLGEAWRTARGYDSFGEFELPLDIRKPIIYVRYRYDLPNAHKRIQKAVGTDGFIFGKELRPKAEDDDADHVARQKVIEGGLLGALPEVAANKKSDRFKISERMLAARNPREALLELRGEWLGANEVEA